MRFLLIGLFAGIGCGSTCDTLAADECSGTKGCTEIEGQPVVDDGYGGSCVDFNTPAEGLGCRSSTFNCDNGVTFAKGDAGDLYWFPDACIPVDFSEVRAADAAAGACD